MDESVIKYLEPGTGKAQHGYFWTIKRPGGDAVFHWATTRVTEVLQKIVPVELTQPPPPEASGFAQRCALSVSRPAGAFGSPASSNAMAMHPTAPSPRGMKARSPSPRAGRTHGASSLKPRRPVRTRPTPCSSFI